MAKFSPTFCIDVSDNINDGQATTVTNPGQAFELVGVLASGVNTAVVTVKKNTGAGATAGVATIIAAGSSCQITDANASFAATDNIHIGAATQNATRVTLICRAVDANAATWTNSTPA